MHTRRLGRTQHHSSLVIFGGAALGRVSQAEADAALDMALAAGINHIDIAPSYGQAETLTGPWLAQHRSQFFLGCKTTQRNYAAAWAELEQSLRLLHTDHLELHQLHAVTHIEELDAAFAPGGAMEALQAAREQGLTRWLGITGHGLQAPAIQSEALRRFDFDTVMFPINPVLYANDAYRRDAEALLQTCQERDVAVMILKSIAKEPWGSREQTYHTWYLPYDTDDTIQLGVNFALSQPGVTAIAAAGDTRLLPKVIAASEQFTPMDATMQAALIAQAQQLEPLFA